MGVTFASLVGITNGLKALMVLEELRVAALFLCVWGFRAPKKTFWGDLCFGESRVARYDTINRKETCV